MQTVTAGMNRIRFLYNYQRFDAARLERFLATNSIYLSDTKGFNDPWDCRPCCDLTELDDPAFYERQVQVFLSAWTESSTPTCPMWSIRKEPIDCGKIGHSLNPVSIRCRGWNLKSRKGIGFTASRQNQPIR